MLGDRTRTWTKNCEIVIYSLYTTEGNEVFNERTKMFAPHIPLNIKPSFHSSFSLSTVMKPAAACSQKQNSRSVTFRYLASSLI